MDNKNTNRKQRHEKTFWPRKKRRNSGRQTVNVAGNGDKTENSISCGFVLNHITRFTATRLSYQFRPLLPRCASFNRRVGCSYRTLRPSGTPAVPLLPAGPRPRRSPSSRSVSLREGVVTHQSHIPELPRLREEYRISRSSS